MIPYLHELETLVPDVIEVALSHEVQANEAHSILAGSLSMIPITVLPARAGRDFRIVWLDVGDHVFTEWKFRYSIQTLVANAQQIRAITTKISYLLEETPALENALYPAGFIFQMSLCGSTLLAKALARSPENLVLNEGTPLHEGLWDYLSSHWTEPVDSDASQLSLIRRMILTLGRRRMPVQRRYFVKFRSWNTIFIDVILKAFPDVPCLFLYRDPLEVLVSALRKTPTGYFRFKNTPMASYLLRTPEHVVQRMTALEYYRHLYLRYFESVLQSGSRNIAYLNYAHLTPENLAPILTSAFRYQPGPLELKQLRAQFDFYSKDDLNAVPFTSDREEKQQGVTADIDRAVTSELDGPYRALERSEKNLGPRLRPA